MSRLTENDIQSLLAQTYSEDARSRAERCVNCARAT